MPTLEKTAGKLALVKLEYHPTIHDMPTDERPRVRLKHYGPKALSTAELLAIILRTGTSRDNVIELAGQSAVGKLRARRRVRGALWGWLVGDALRGGTGAALKGA